MKQTKNMMLWKGQLPKERFEASRFATVFGDAEKSANIKPLSHLNEDVNDDLSV
jgi:hypothetical protein